LGGDFGKAADSGGQARQQQRLGVRGIAGQQRSATGHDGIESVSL
jgi:hypothetical protein